MENLVENLTKYNIQSLLIIGGFEASSNIFFLIIYKLAFMPFNPGGLFQSNPRALLFFRPMKVYWSYMMPGGTIKSCVFPCVSFLPPSATMSLAPNSAWVLILLSMQLWR